jgi:hypothetical protein
MNVAAVFLDSCEYEDNSESQKDCPDKLQPELPKRPEKVAENDS